MMLSMAMMLTILTSFIPVAKTDTIITLGFVKYYFAMIINMLICIFMEYYDGHVKRAKAFQEELKKKNDELSG